MHISDEVKKVYFTLSLNKHNLDYEQRESIKK